ncbi:MAG: hypothetical protein JWO32_1349 [Bacteroidetes bacterium]|nr:hypothetical protein [Bacteroidota bacterium]
MKKIVVLLILSFPPVFSFSQSDTLYTINNEKIACHVIEINSFEIKYRKYQASDLILYTANNAFISRYKLINGFTETVSHNHHDSLSALKELTGQLPATIRVHPFSFLLNHVSISLEKVIKRGMSLNLELGYICSFFNSTLNTAPAGLLHTSSSYSGYYIKPGFKLYVNKNNAFETLKSSHPLNGYYVKIDMALSEINYHGFSTVIYPSGTRPAEVFTDFKTIAYGGYINFGKQNFLASRITLDGYLGLGFTGQMFGFDDYNYLLAKNFNYTNANLETIYQYHGFMRAPEGLSITGGLSIGYVLQSKSARLKWKERARLLKK